MTEYGNIRYGVVTDGEVKSCFGIQISNKHDHVIICHINYYGETDMTKSYIQCSESGTK